MVCALYLESGFLRIQPEVTTKCRCDRLQWHWLAHSVTSKRGQQPVPRWVPRGTAIGIKNCGEASEVPSFVATTFTWMFDPAANQEPRMRCVFDGDCPLRCDPAVTLVSLWPCGDSSGEVLQDKLGICSHTKSKTYLFLCKSLDHLDHPLLPHPTPASGEQVEERDSWSSSPEHCLCPGCIPVS